MGRQELQALIKSVTAATAEIGLLAQAAYRTYVMPCAAEGARAAPFALGHGDFSGVEAHNRSAVTERFGKPNRVRAGNVWMPRNLFRRGGHERPT